jgi:hypothetical protein
MQTLELFAMMDKPVPEPPPAFWASLSRRVTEESNAGSSWTWWPALAGGLSAVLAVVLYIIVSTPTPDGTLNGAQEYFESYEQVTYISMSLEEEIWSLSGSETALIESVYEQDLLSNKELDFLEADGEDPLDSLFGAESMEIMDGETIRLFEKLINEMVPEQTERG